MTEEEIKGIAVSTVDKLENENSDIIPYYLVKYVLDSTLAKSRIESPIVGFDPITMKMLREIRRINPELSGKYINKVYTAICRYLAENNYADQYFEYNRV